MRLGELIKTKRIKKGLDQKALAEAISVSISSISLVESMKNFPSPEHLKQLCEFLGINVDKGLNMYLFEKHGIKR